MKHPLDNKTVDWCADQINTGALVAFNQEIGVGRGTALAKALKVSRQFIHSTSNGKNGLSDSQWDAFKYGMSIVELDEMRSLKSIEHNIVKAACNSHNKDSEIKNMSLAELDKWVEVLGRVA